MNPKSLLAQSLLGVVVLLGLLGDLLLNTYPWGLNFGVWVLCLEAALVLTARWRSVSFSGGGRWLLLPAAGFALAFAWRDSPGLGVANLIALFVCLALAVSYSRVGRITMAGLVQYALAGLGVAFWFSGGLLLLLGKDIQWSDLHKGRIWTRQVAAIGRGLALALPLVLVFGALFASADAVFSAVAADLFDWGFEEVAGHLFWWALWTGIAGGIARGSFLGGPSTEWLPDQPELPSIGAAEVGIVLGTLNALFLTFVLVQLRYLFGGASLVEASVTITYAEYARRGFFELVIVIGLALPVLLAADALLRRESTGNDRMFRFLAGAMVALLFVIVASALQRMSLYQQEFGLTELRLYTTAFMGWLAVSLVWFAATVLRGRRNRFAFGAMVSGLLLVAGLNVLNPDAFIVAANSGRAQVGQRFDATYIGALSADAVPEIVRNLPVLPEGERERVAKRVLERWSDARSGDLRQWNWGRQVAWQTVESNRTALEQMAGQGR